MAFKKKLSSQQSGKRPWNQYRQLPNLKCAKYNLKLFFVILFKQCVFLMIRLKARIIILLYITRFAYLKHTSSLKESWNQVCEVSIWNILTGDCHQKFKDFTDTYYLFEVKIHMKAGPQTWLYILSLVNCRTVNYTLSKICHRTKNVMEIMSIKRTRK